MFVLSQVSTVDAILELTRIRSDEQARSVFVRIRYEYNLVAAKANTVTVTISFWNLLLGKIGGPENICRYWKSWLLSIFNTKIERHLQRNIYR